MFFNLLYESAQPISPLMDLKGLLGFTETPQSKNSFCLSLPTTPIW